MQKLPEKPPSDLGFSFDLSGSDDEFKRLVSEYNNRYLYWDELRYRIEDPERRKQLWTVIKILRQMRYEHIPFRTLDLKYSFIPEIIRGLHTIDRYLSGTIQIHNKAIRMEPSYIINSLMEEAISSSILEGAATTRKAAKEMLREGRKPKTHAEQMVVNNYEALQLILKKKDAPLTRELILDVQRIVTAGTIEDKYVGKFRTDNEVVVADSGTGLVYHTPPDFDEIEGFVGDFCTFANEDKTPKKEALGTFIHPVIKGILLHYLMGYYHPFNDGNGRTARTIFYWFVLSRGYWLFEYLPVSRIILKSRKNYGLAYLYTEYDESDLTYFLRYNISCIVQALDDLLKFLERKQTEQNATKAIIKKIDEINQRQADILREMMEHSDEYYSIRKIMQMYAVVYQTARTDLMDLEKRGFLIKQQRGREFLFIFNENSDLWKKSPVKSAKE
ncbi:MAG: Fic family protein [Methanomicrobiales archaeon]|nr:Fic family protein [Methanomicrobiales archaeon]